ncbi:uncharacterized protein LOC144356723 [Saccoglossus kowalevskii]
MQNSVYGVCQEERPRPRHQYYAVTRTLRTPTNRTWIPIVDALVRTLTEFSPPASEERKKMTVPLSVAMTGGKSPTAATSTKEKKQATVLPAVGSAKAPIKINQRPLGTARSSKERLIHTPAQLEGHSDNDKHMLLTNEDVAATSEIIKLRDLLINPESRTSDDDVALSAVQTANTMLTISLPNIKRPSTRNGKIQHPVGAKVRLKDLETAMDRLNAVKKPNLEEFYEVNSKWFGRTTNNKAGLGSGPGGNATISSPKKRNNNIITDKLAPHIGDTKLSMTTDRSSGLLERTINSPEFRTENSFLKSKDHGTGSTRTPHKSARKLTLSDYVSLEISNTTTNYNPSPVNGYNGRKRSVRFSISNEIREYDTEAPVTSPTETLNK